MLCLAVIPCDTMGLSDGSSAIFRKVDIPTGRYTDKYEKIGKGSIFRQVDIPTNTEK